MILVNGQARSGTTVVTKAIGAHPEVVSNMRESSYINEVAGLFQFAMNRPDVVRELPGGLDSFKKAYRAATMNVLFPQRMFAALPQTKFLSTFSSLRSARAEYLKEIFPDLKMVIIIREGTEVVASRLVHEHIKHAGDFETHCAAWANTIEMLKWARRQPKFFLLRHEDLKTEETCRAAFAGLQAEFGMGASDAPADFVLQGLINSTSPTDDRKGGLSERSQRWRSWTAQQRETFQRVCASTMEQCGYQIPW
jgi:hypothetical protein